MTFDLQPVLKNDLMILRPLQEEDWEGLYAVASDPLIWEQHPQKDRYQRPVFRSFFDNGIKSGGALVALDAKTGQIIGSSRYRSWNPEEKSVVIGWTFLSRACWGQGYNRAMKKLMLDHAFRFADTVFFDVAKKNQRSRKAMEKIGGELVAEKEVPLADGSLYPHVIYQITKERGHAMTRKFSGNELVVATHNKGKLAEIGEMFNREGLNIRLFSAADFGIESPAETGTTCIENAILKAKFVSAATGKISLADDSGLFIEALGGAPGVYSADWAELPEGKRDFGMAMQRVHKEMGNSPNRKAYFTSVLTLCWPDGHCETVEGFAHGNIVWPPRGDKGHGYDPIFMPEGRTVTYGEIEDAEKNNISHRADSFRRMMDKCFR